MGSDEPPEGFSLDQRIKVATIVLSVMVNLGGIVWWAATLQERVTAVEVDHQRHSASIDKLAESAKSLSLETAKGQQAMDDLLTVVGRIEKKLDTKR